MKPLAYHQEQFNIIVPLISSNQTVDNPLRVTVKSPKQYRRAVFKLAQYFRREFEYDFVQYGFDGNETDINHVAFLWVHPEALRFLPDFRVPCIGAACFRWNEWEDLSPCWTLDWVWFHPYSRRHGLLTEIWPKFKSEFGDFICQRPLSNEMQSFLNKMNSL